MSAAHCFATAAATTATSDTTAAVHCTSASAVYVTLLALLCCTGYSLITAYTAVADTTYALLLLYDLSLYRSVQRQQQRRSCAPALEALQCF
jgi:hypothetical protein